ncbi:hypothetical protein F5Y12DRAFT_431091 [Xylaria sp. FL1777]|nr:hypothetical protein F5Y12DRAFT_431091 [Xylaria sp. FL1777]
MSEVNVKGGPLVDTGPGLGPIILGFNWAFVGLGIIAVGLRIWFRRKIGYELHDWMMFFATGMTIVFEAILTESLLWGLGRDYASITVEDYKQLQYWLLLAQFFVNFQPIFSRWSIAIFLIRIFGTARPWFKYFLITWVALIFVGGILANVLTFTYLDPLEAYWDPSVEHHYRFNPYIEYYTSLVLGWLFAGSDLTFAIIPISFVWNLNLPTRKKVGLSALFAGSLLAFFASITKTIFSTLEIRGALPKTSGPTSGGILWITSGVEQGLVIVLGTVPTLGPLTRLQLFNNFYESLMYLVTFGRRSRRSSASQSVYREEVEMGQPRRLTDEDERSAKAPVQFADDTLASLDHETAKYVKRTDDFVAVRKSSRGQLN